MRMAGESFAIIAVFLVMCLMLLRADKKAVAFISLPLIAVPLFFLLGLGIGSILPWIPPDTLFPGMVVAGALVGIAGCAAMTIFIKNRKVKTAYFAVGALYLAALAVAYLIRLID